MRTNVFAAVLGLGLLAAGSAQAHFKLEQPPDRLQTDANGDPLGTNGTQKTNPCGDGTPSGLSTRVTAGSTLHIKLTETVPHGGHYRVALIAGDTPSTTDLPEPAVTLSAGECDTAAIESPVVAPVLADNLFPHTQAEAAAGKVWETDVQIPMQVGSATLQVLEFMTPHPPQCFYHHCAQLEIVQDDAGTRDGGVVIGADGGVVLVDAGGTGTPGTGGSPSDAGGAPKGDAGSNGSNDDGGSSGGCNVGGGATPSLVVLGGFGLVALSLIRRKRQAK